MHALVAPALLAAMTFARGLWQTVGWYFQSGATTLVISNLIVAGGVLAWAHAAKEGDAFKAGESVAGS